MFSDASDLAVAFRDQTPYLYDQGVGFYLCDHLSLLGSSKLRPHWLIIGVSMEAQPLQKRRRLVGKQTVGHLAVMLACVHCAVRPALEELAWKEAFLNSEDLEQETKGQKRTAYLVTLPHPSSASTDIPSLRSTSTLTRADVVRMFVDIFANPEYVDAGAASRGGPSVRLERMVVFRELHAPNEDNLSLPHFHVAVLLSQPSRFVAYKRALRNRYNVASHWSCTHEGYYSTVRYGYRQTPKKQEADLDKEPLAWDRHGAHPPLWQVCEEPNTVNAWRKRRENKLQNASAQGKPEPRPTEMDLYIVIVEQGFRNTPDDTFAHKRLIAYLKDHASPALWLFAWKLRAKLPGIIDDVWSWETVHEDLAIVATSRLERLQAVAQSPCVCQGVWRQYAEYALRANSIDPLGLCSDIYFSLAYGRHESLPVVTLVGKAGGEGKSFLLSPLAEVFGSEYVQTTPQSGQFPLLGLETKKAVFLDEWEFDRYSPLSWSTQLMWFDNKAICITRPQNNCNGHLIYRGTAPIFITAKLKNVGPMHERAQAAAAEGKSSDDTMMMRRLRCYLFTEKLPIPVGVVVPQCGCCWSQMILGYAHQAGHC